jgi:hypothetical protein
VTHDTIIIHDNLFKFGENEKHNYNGKLAWNTNEFSKRTNFHNPTGYGVN